MSNEIIVSTNDGKIRGIKNKSPIFDAEFYSFYGIPYAEPPIGDLRFKDPMKVKPWDGIRDASLEKEGFTQFSLLSWKYTGSEDSLYVNIHTPNLPSAAGEPMKAVVALIHPGGNVWGSPDSSNQGSPDAVMHQDIVYVTIGYRLNVLGFLNLNMDECSGNQALKDIIMAFHWIKNNVQFFNGDPNNVTALGCSSGAVNLHLLQLSPAARGLFHKAIYMGDYVFDCLKICSDEHVKLAFDFANEFGFQGDNAAELLSFLKSLPALTIIKKMSTFRPKILKDTIQASHWGGFTATIDQGERAILPLSPRKLIASMERIPLMFGICEKETASAFLGEIIQPIERNFKNGYRQNHWGWMHQLHDDELEEIHHKIESFYSHNISHNNSSYIVKEAILTDAAFSEVYDTLIDFTSQKLPSSVYVYKFQYIGEMTESSGMKFVLRNFSPVENFQGTYHSDDFCYWMSFQKPETENTVRFMSTFTKLLTNFAKTGNPNYENIPVQWRPSTPEQPCYLSITDKLILVDGKLNGKRWEFWDRLKKQYRRGGIPFE